MELDIRTNTIKQFNTVFEDFLDKISPITGTFYYNSFKQLTKINAVIVIKQFENFVLPHQDEIENRNESFFFNNPDEYIGEHNMNKDDGFIRGEVDKIREIYTDIDDDTKNMIWKYFNALLKLCIIYTNSI